MGQSQGTAGNQVRPQIPRIAAISGHIHTACHLLRPCVASHHTAAGIPCRVVPVDGMILITFDDGSTLEQRTLAAGLVFDLSPVQLRLAAR